MAGLLGTLTALDWSSMAVPAISILEKILRPLIVYFFLVLALRIAGKREMAQLNSFDFVVLLLLSNTVQNAIIGNDNSVSGGIIGAISLLAANFLVVRFFFRHPKLEAAFEGRPDLLVEDGRLNRKRLEKELITEAELESAARKQGIGSLAEVERAEIDPDGELVFVQKAPAPELSRHAEILARLDALAAEMEKLKAEIRKEGGAPRNGG
jgi:uncharacterized membrane protein YcaP (DUF421 family)